MTTYTDDLITLLERVEAHYAAPAADDDTDGWLETLIDGGARSGIIVERVERPAFGDLWFDFSAGDGAHGVKIGVDLNGARSGLHLAIAGHCINEQLSEVWTLADLRQLHTDIGRILADERFLGALAEQRPVAGH